MGVVYKAEDINLKRTVALKFLSPAVVATEEDKARFVQEAQAAAALDHPNICTVFEFGEDQGHTFISMAYIEGRSLREILKSGALGIEEALDIVIQTAKGLSRAHEKAIVHRDITSANIMVTPKGEVKIMDFGLAKLGGGATITRIGTTMGTLGYMSPEQARGDGVDHRTDIWSLGVVLYEMLTGRLPFLSDYDQALIYSILNEEPKPIAKIRPDVPLELERVVARAMAKDLEQRYQEISEMLDDLEAIRRDVEMGIVRRRLGWLGVRIVRRTRRYVAVVIAIAVVVSILVLTLDRLQLFQGKTGTKTVAVLPFENLGDEKEDEYFSDGITEDIIIQLSKIGDLTVISWSSVLDYKERKKNIKQIARELGVRNILTGSVQRAGRRARIVARLTNARNGQQIWGEKYDRELRDIFDIQSDVAEKIALALEAKLSRSEREHIERQPTVNLTAYDYYLKGRDHYYRYDGQSNERSIELFKKAIEFDPNYALAYAGLGDAYAQRANTFGFPLEWADSAVSMGQKALSIDSNLAEAYKSLGTAYSVRGWIRKAFNSTRQAVELNPNFAPAVGNIGAFSMIMGELDKALYWFKRALTLSPGSAFYCSAMGSIYFCLNDDAEAERWFRKALLLQPDSDKAHAGLGYLYLAQGKYHSAREVSRNILSNDSNNFYALHLAGDVAIASGDYGEAEKYYEELLAVSYQTNYYSGKRPSTSLGYLYIRDGRRDEAGRMFEESIYLDRKELDKGSEWADVAYDLAAVYAAQGNREGLYKWLQDAIDKGWRFFRLGMRDPIFGAVRDEERFIQMMDQVKMKVDEMRIQAAKS